MSQYYSHQTNKSNKSRLNAQRQAFLLTFFEGNTDQYEEKEVNGFVLVKHIVNGDPSVFEVAIYPKEHFTKSQEAIKSPVDPAYAEFIRAINDDK